MKKNLKKVCQYCYYDLQEFDCKIVSSKYDMPKNKFLKMLFKIFLIIYMPFTFLQFFIRDYSKDKKLAKAGKIITCVNKDCIGYLDGCLGKKKGWYGY